MANTSPIDRAQARATALAEIQLRQRLEQAAWTPGQRLALAQELWDMAYALRGTMPSANPEGLANYLRTLAQTQGRWQP